MKRISKWFILIVLGLLIINPKHVLAQRGRGGNHPHVKGKAVRKQHPHHRVIVRSRYRPAKIVVFHPHWAPKRAYNRRWVFFPRYNFYWDNWRQMYVYRNGTVWVMNATPPPVIMNVNLDKETNYELKEDDDDVDDVYKTNDYHVKEFNKDSIK